MGLRDIAVGALALTAAPFVLAAAPLLGPTYFARKGVEEQKRANQAQERLNNARLRQQSLQQIGAQRRQQAQVENTAASVGGSIGSSSVTGTIFSSQSTLGGNLSFLSETAGLQNEIGRHSTKANKYNTYAQVTQSIFSLAEQGVKYL